MSEPINGAVERLKKVLSSFIYPQHIDEAAQDILSAGYVHRDDVEVCKKCEGRKIDWDMNRCLNCQGRGVTIKGNI